MVFDWDDYGLNGERDLWFLDRLLDFRMCQPEFRCTLFTVPGLVAEGYWGRVPDWIELAVHGHRHPTPVECAEWTYARAWKAISTRPPGFVTGWKSPGWQTSQGTYAAMKQAGWWVADQHLYDEGRPEGLLTYMWEDGDNWHGHVGNDCGNGLEETWDTVVELVRSAESFEFASEKAVAWHPLSVS